MSRISDYLNSMTTFSTEKINLQFENTKREVRTSAVTSETPTIECEIIHPEKSTQYRVNLRHTIDINHCVRGSLSKSVVSPQVDVHQNYFQATTSCKSRVNNKILLHQPIGTGPETTWDASSTGTTTCGTSSYETVSSTSTSTTSCRHPTSTDITDSSTRVSTSTSTSTNSSPLQLANYI